METREKILAAMERLFDPGLALRFEEAKSWDWDWFGRWVERIDVPATIQRVECCAGSELPALFADRGARTHARIAYEAMHLVSLMLEDPNAPAPKLRDAIETATTDRELCLVALRDWAKSDEHLQDLKDRQRDSERKN